MLQQVCAEAQGQREVDSSTILDLFDYNQFMSLLNPRFKHPCNNIREDSTHGHDQIVNTKIRLFIFFAIKEEEEALYSQQKQDQELTVAQIMNSLLPNSDIN